MEQQTISAANASYEPYAGEQNGINIKQLITTVIYHNNNSDSDKIVAINGQTNVETLEEVKNSYNASEKYTVSFEYNESGFINNIIIK